MEATSRETVTWRKSTYSGNGGQDCVEVGIWRKSTYSGNGGQNCVEVGSNGSIQVRDTKDRGNGPVLCVSPEAWRKLTTGLK